MMKKILISSLVLVMFIFLIGCLEYKTYSDNNPQSEKQLLEEISQIEQELALKDTEQFADTEQQTNTIEKEVTLPTIEQDFPDEVQVINVNENDFIKLKVKINDPDGDEITSSFSPPLSNIGEWKTNYGDAGEYLVTLTANDGTHTVEKPIKIIINRVNVPPIIEGIKDIFAKEGDTLTLQPKVTDPNNDPISVKITDPLKSGTFVTDYTSAGEYQVTITASDGELETETSCKLVIENINEKPIINNVDNLVVNEGETVIIEPKVTDLDQDRVDVSISEPVGSDGMWATDYTNHGEYMITVIADDGTDQVTKRIKLTVNDINMPPEIIEISLEIK